jgi:hypothetical protein
MSIEVCIHGVEIKGMCPQCYRSADPGSYARIVYNSDQRRAAWIRNNVASLVDCTIDDWPHIAVDRAEWLADVLAYKGYL